MTEKTVWQPDVFLIDAAKAGKLSIRPLDGPDRAWVVAGLAAAGYTADATAKLLGCSLRLIRSIRAEPMTIVATYGLRLELERAAESRTAETALRAAERRVEEARAETERCKASIDRLIVQLDRARSGQPRLVESPAV